MENPTLRFIKQRAQFKSQKRAREYCWKSEGWRNGRRGLMQPATDWWCVYWGMPRSCKVSMLFPFVYGRYEHFCPTLAVFDGHFVDSSCELSKLYYLVLFLSHPLYFCVYLSYILLINMQPSEKHVNEHSINCTC